RGWSPSRHAIWRWQKKVLGIAKLGWRKARGPREPSQDGVEELAQKVARDRLQDRAWISVPERKEVIILSLRDLANQAKHRGKGHRGRLLTLKEIRRIKRRGYRAERELVRKLRVHGFRAVRIPVSAPSKEPLPDVFATKDDRLLAFEVKAPRAKRAYFRKDQVNKLFRFLDLFAPYPQKQAVLAAKFPYSWTLKLVNEPDDYVLHKGEKNSFRLK
ncbi:MAG: hypothetical protein ACE5OW_08540, partial [Candidatus Bathyarchaeia archaeon]